MSPLDPRYPQMPPLTEAGLLALYQKTPFARLGTINKDGTPHISPTLFLHKDGQFLIGTQVRSRKVRNIKRSSQVSLLIDVTAPVLQGALIYGTAELDYENVFEKRVEIFTATGSSLEEAQGRASFYMGKWESVIIRITPTRIASFDYAQEL